MQQRGILTGIGLLALSLVLTGCQTSQPKTEHTITQVSKSKKANLRVKPLASKPAPTWHHYQKHVTIPILMYHSISTGNQLRVPAKQFDQEMTYLHSHHYYTLTTAEAIRAFKTNTLPQRKVVWLTLDDAYRDNETAALPILRAKHLHATINYITSFSQRKNHLSLTAVDRMRQSGWIEFESHTVHHLDLNTLTNQQQSKELTQSKQWLDQHLKQKTRMICYPAGRANDATAKIAKKAGYEIGLTTAPGLGNVHDQGWFNLHRQRVVPQMSSQAFAKLLTTDATDH